jgi:hypothetical protein
MRSSISGERHVPARRPRRAAGAGAAGLGTLLAALWPAVGTACPVCFGAASERVLHSYYATAAALTVLPLVLVGGFVAWLIRGMGGGAARDPDDGGGSSDRPRIGA